MQNLPLGLTLLILAWTTSLARTAEASRPRVTGLAHVALWVHDVEQSRRFYKDFLGFEEPYSLTNSNGSLALTFIKINDRQYLELFPERETNSDRLYHISVETNDAEALRAWLGERNVTVPDKVGKGRIGNLNFNVHDPDDHQVEIVQYTPDGWTLREKGKFVPDTRISTRMMHAGVLVGDLDASLKFYRDNLGGTETWRGGRANQPLSWVNVKLADSPDYIELMLYESLPEPAKRGTAHHICLEVADVEKALTVLKQRAERCHYTRTMEIKTGINRKRQINVYDPDETRVELMEPNTVDGISAPSSSAPPPAPAESPSKSSWNEFSAPVSANYVIRDFKFHSGESLPELRVHYRAFGSPQRDAKGMVTNAVLILHGTTGNGSNFLRAEFAGELFGAGQRLDVARHYLVLPDGIGHGQSSKPSDGLHAKFPHYGYRDMVEAQYRLLTEGLQVNHLRLVMGTSMGGMHTWLWGETHPEFVDALMPLASLPTQISGRNRVWRRIIIDAIRTDPDWREGEYAAQPHGLRTALEMLWFMGNNPVQRFKEAPTLAKADEVLDKFVVTAMKTYDANDMLYALEASHDYDPGPDLEKIQAPLLAVNSADDLINPPELGILEREIKRVKRGRAVMIPLSDQTRGHGTHTLAAVWEEHLAELLRISAQ